MSDLQPTQYQFPSVEIPPPAPQRVVPMNIGPTQRYYSSPASWAGAMVVCCLMIGGLASWIVAERRQIGVEQDRAAAMQNAAVRADGDAEDLGKLLSDPRTQVIHLIGSQKSAVHQASLAWNDMLQKGALFCDQLPPLDVGANYTLMVKSDNDVSHSIAKIEVRPGTSIYPFKPSDPTNHVTRFEIRTPGNADKEAMLWGEVR